MVTLVPFGFWIDSSLPKSALAQVIILFVAAHGGVSAIGSVCRHFQGESNVENAIGEAEDWLVRVETSVGPMLHMGPIWHRLCQDALCEERNT